MRTSKRGNILFSLVCVAAIGLWLASFIAVTTTVNNIMLALGPQEIPYFPFGDYLEGNPDEVLSHYSGFFSCTGIFAVIMIVAWAERSFLELRHSKIPRRTAKLSLGFVPLAWLISLSLDAEGASRVAFFAHYVFLIICTFAACHLLLCRIANWIWDGLWTILGIAVFFWCQVVYEPSGTGSPNNLVLVFMVAAGLLYQYAWSVASKSSANPKSLKL